MKRELGVLNLVCVIAAILFVGFAALNALTSPEFFTIDNLFITMVCLVMALMFAVNPLLYLNSEGRLPIPFARRLSQPAQSQVGGPAPAPLLDAKGRPVPPDVRQLVARLGQTQAKDI
ncbi:MAG TPA: hypothetical protein VJ180_07400 [Pyrinomonadaceae bacterium]|nr:hypothetical protein [Pyrinomonadaceae bacterium]